MLLCPHAKTTMAPALFRRQLAAGSWGLTFATGPQVRAAREHGVPRIFYANELVGAADIRYVCAELRRDPGFEFYCLVDSVAGVRLLAERVAAERPGRPVNVLVEGGLAGPAAACGTWPPRSRWRRRSAPRPRTWPWSGVEGFEGLARSRDDGDREPVVREFLAFLVQIAAALDSRDLFDVPEVLLTAGGSAFSDVVIDVLTGARLRRPTRVMLRSGCYLTRGLGPVRAGPGRNAHAAPDRAHRTWSPRWRCGPRCSRSPNPACSSCPPGGATSARTPGTRSR